MTTSLKRAQEFHREFEERHAAIVHQLRSAGWDREDAVERADELEAKALKIRELTSDPESVYSISIR